MDRKLTKEQLKIIRRLEGYYGAIVGGDEMPINQEDIESKIVSLKQGLFMMLSAGELTEDQYSEAQTLITELYNTTHKQ